MYKVIAREGKKLCVVDPKVGGREKCERDKGEITYIKDCRRKRERERKRKRECRDKWLVIMA